MVSATDGKGIFTEAGCAMCHTLAAAGATGTAGPNLDYANSLSAAQIRAVAEFVSQNAGK